MLPVELVERGGPIGSGQRVVALEDRELERLWNGREDQRRVVVVLIEETLSPPPAHGGEDADIGGAHVTGDHAAIYQARRKRPVGVEVDPSVGEAPPLCFRVLVHKVGQALALAYGADRGE